MPVRLPGTPQLSNSPLRLPQASGRDPAAQALGSVAQSIASVGSAFEGLAGQIQERENTFALSSARNQLDEARSQHFLALRNEPDPARRIALTNDFLAQQKQAVADPGHAPAVQDRLTMYFDNWATDVRSQAAADAARLSDQRAKLALDNELQAAARTNDRARFDQALDDAGNLVLPEQRQAYEAEFARRATFSAIVEQIDDEPLLAEGVLDHDMRSRYPELDDDSIARLQRYAQTKGNEAKAELWNDTLNAALDGKILSAEELAGMAEAGIISASERASYLRAWHSAQEPAFDPAIYDSAYSAITTFDPAKDPTGANLATLRSQLATLPLPSEHRKELRRRLDERAGGSTERSKRHRLEADFTQQTDLAFDQGRFGGWWSLQDHDNDPTTAERKVIDFRDFQTALATRRKFLDAWDSYLQAAPADLDPLEARATYDALFDKLVLQNDEPAIRSGVPTVPPPVDYSRQIDEAIGAPPETGEETSATFGGQPILPPGRFYQSAVATVFGGSADPIDNGQSAFGGTTGAGGREGVAIPAKILSANFPGKDKRWLAENVRVTVSTPAGITKSLPLADLGTAEEIWQKNNAPTLDLTPGAARSLGGTPLYRDGKLVGLKGLDGIRFAITAGEAPEQGATWEQYWQRWFAGTRPTHPDQIKSALPAAIDRYALAQADPSDQADTVLPPYPD